ncbi:TPA: transposase, partial [Staphylococcus delphini]|nr:transposase [Staphylococcus delphini]HEC2228478.1 transposase [Staphylococcus delphini]
MSFIKKLTVNEYLRIFEDYEKGYSFQFIIDSLNIDINAQTLSYKYRDYKAHGIDVLLPNTKRKCYPKALKLNIINEYLYSDLSSYDLAIKYGIRSATQVKNWIKMYTEGKEISDKSQYSEVYKMKSRKVTYEERVNIVQYY